MPKTEGEPTRKVAHKETRTELYQGKNALTAEQARELLGWEEERGKQKFGAHYLLKDLRGTKVRCTRNLINRPLYTSKVESLRQEILHRRWRFNGEPIIVGCSDLLLNGQHQCVALITAVQEWEANREHWSLFWPTEPMIEKVIVYGVPEDDDTANTMDTCKSRDLIDVIYRCHYFGPLEHGQCAALSRVLGYAVRLLWDRTGQKLDAYAPEMNHSEAIDHINRHPRLIQAAKHIWEENGEHGIAHYISPGYAAGLLYLQAACRSDRERYTAAQSPNEELLDAGLWDQACDYWTELAKGAEGMKAVRDAFNLTGQYYGGIKEIPQADRRALLVLAWLSYLDGKGQVKPTDLKLEYDVNEEDGSRRLVGDPPIVGGIDVGSADAIDEEVVRADDPDEKEIKARAKSLRKRKEKQVTAKSKDRRGHRAGKDWAKGDMAWVREDDGEHYYGSLAEDPYDTDSEGRKVSILEEGQEEPWEVDVSQLRLEYPDPDKAKTKAPAGDKPVADKPKPSPAAKAKPAGKAKPDSWLRANIQAWVSRPEEEPWQGRVIEIAEDKARLIVGQGFKGAGNTMAVMVKHLYPKQPAAAAV